MSRFLYMYVLTFWILSHPTQALQERHFCYYRFTVMTKAEAVFPEFSAAGVCDDREFTHYSNELERWIKSDNNQIEPFMQEPYDPRDRYKDELKSLSNCTQCSELHVLQRIVGCKLERFPNGSVKSLTAFDEYGFDGEDLIAFNFDTMKWIEKNPKAEETKREWDHQTDRNKFIKDYLNKFMNWISKYNSTNINSPDVRVFTRKAPDDKLNLTCHVTDFYPKDIEVYIRLDKTILDDQVSSGVRPNSDRSFQMKISVKIDRNHKGVYDCVVIHSSVTLPIVVSLKWGAGGRSSWIAVGPSIAAVVVVLVLLVIGCCCYNMRRSTGLMGNSSGYGATELNHLTSPESS